MTTNEEILAQLPTLTIEALPEGRALGRAIASTGARHVRRRESVLVRERTIELIPKPARFGKRVRFRFADPGDTQELDRGHSYPIIDSYYAERVDLVLDRSRTWERTEFHPVDAYAWKIPGGTYITPVHRFDASDHSEFDVNQVQRLKNAWDHEHCTICSECICQIHGPWGFRDTNDVWVCESCYSRYVESRSLGFLLDPPESADDPAPPWKARIALWRFRRWSRKRSRKSAR